MLVHKILSMADKPRSKIAGINGTVVFLPRIYDETLMLLAESHQYFEHQGAMQQRLMGERRRAMYISEMSRITLRLSCVMAWLLARRAVLDGTLSQDSADHNHRLECRDVCMHQHIEAESMLPDTMGDILDRTYELYVRIARLDDETGKHLHHDGAPPPPVNPLTFS